MPSAVRTASSFNRATASVFPCPLTGSCPASAAALNDNLPPDPAARTGATSDRTPGHGTGSIGPNSLQFGGPTLTDHPERHESRAKSAKRTNRCHLSQRRDSAVGKEAVKLRKCRTEKILHEYANT